MASANADTVRSGYEAFAAGDVPKVLGLFDPAIEWTVPEDGEWGGTFEGPDGVGGFFVALPGRYGAFEVAPSEFLPVDERVIVLGEHRFGADVVPFAHVWTLRDGKVTRFHEYTDNVALRQHALS